MATYVYWWSGGALKCPGRPDLGGGVDPSTAALPATIPFTI